MQATQTQAPITFDERLRFTMPESVELLKISRSTIYKEIAAGRLACIKQGGRVFLPGSEIARLSKVQR